MNDGKEWTLLHTVFIDLWRLFFVVLESVVKCPGAEKFSWQGPVTQRIFQEVYHAVLMCHMLTAPHLTS